LGNRYCLHLRSHHQGAAPVNLFLDRTRWRDGTGRQDKPEYPCYSVSSGAKVRKKVKHSLTLGGRKPDAPCRDFSPRNSWKFFQRLIDVQRNNLRKTRNGLVVEDFFAHYFLGGAGRFRRNPKNRSCGVDYPEMSQRGFGWSYFTSPVPKFHNSRKVGVSKKYYLPLTFPWSPRPSSYPDTP
jgi:hypothetical protein